MGTPVEQLQAIRRIRDYAATLSLSSSPPVRQEVEQQIAARQAAERTAVERVHVEEKHLLMQRAEQLAAEITTLESLAGGAAPDEKLTACRRQRDVLLAEIGSVHNAIRSRREEFEQKLADGELQRLDVEEKEALDRVHRDRVAEYESRLAAWRDGAATRDVQLQRLTTSHDRLQHAVEAANDRVEKLRDPLVSRTVAGFLLWAGYSAVAATGAAVAQLLTPPSQQTVVGAFASSMANAAGVLQQSLPQWLVLPVSIVALATVLVSVAGSFWACDKLIRYFDKHWRRRQPQISGFSRSTLGLPSPEVGRRAYVQTLAILPFAYMAGLAFVLLTYRVGTGPSPVAPIISLGPVVLHTAVGSVVTLLASAVFVLYAIKVVEKRVTGEGNSGFRSWEFVVPPLLIVAAFAVAVSRPAPDRYVWGGMALFMVISSIGLAYGVVYRGMFRDVDELSRRLRACESDIEELLSPPELEEPRKAEQAEIRDIRRNYRRHRQLIANDARKRRLRRRDLRPDGSTRSAGSGFLSPWFRKDTTVAEVYADSRLIDSEAAPDEAARRADLQRRLSDLDRGIAEILARTTAREALERLSATRAERDRVRAELETVDVRAAAELGRLGERQAIEIEEFRRGYEIGLMVRPAFGIVQGRTQQAAVDSKKYWRQAEEPR